MEVKQNKTESIPHARTHSTRIDWRREEDRTGQDNCLGIRQSLINWQNPAVGPARTLLDEVDLNLQL